MMFTTWLSLEELTRMENDLMIFSSSLFRKISRNIINLIRSFRWIEASKIRAVQGIPPTERKGHSADIYGDDMYVFGGEDK